MKNLIIFLWEIAKVIAIALIIVIPIRYFLFQPFIVNGQSMEPNFSDNDYLIVEEVSHRFGDPERGEVIVFKYPNNPSVNHIKRIIGLPGETIIIKNDIIEIIIDSNTIILDEAEYLYASGPLIHNIEMTLREDEFFVMGDNRKSSFDSRRWGALSRENIVGRVIVRAFPFNRIKKIKTPNF